MKVPALHEANAAFVTGNLLVGGDLNAFDAELAGRQLLELHQAGVTHIVDVRQEWTDEQAVRKYFPDVHYLHLGIDDIGQMVPAEWFEQGVTYALDAIESGGVVLTHCHMGINRGPSLGFAVLLGLGWDVGDALEAIRAARPIAFVGYADDALRWHHERTSTSRKQRKIDAKTLKDWRRRNDRDLGDVIRKIRDTETGRAMEIGE